MQRNWTTVGAEHVERLGRDDVEREIEALEWREIPVDEPLTVAFMPGAAINEAIRQLGLPRVSRVAISSFDRPAASPDEDGFYPGFYGVEASYKDGLCRVYLLDLGTVVDPLASDFYPGDGDEVEKVAKGGTEVWTIREAVQR